MQFRPPSPTNLGGIGVRDGESNSPSSIGLLGDLGGGCVSSKTIKNISIFYFLPSKKLSVGDREVISNPFNEQTFMKPLN